MSDHAVIIKKKKIIAGDGHHGGAWKVAYADFVTAMMAFFLLMWLLNATTEDQRKGIADYFNPTIPISRISGGGSGALNGDSIFSEDEQLASSGTGGLEGDSGDDDNNARSGALENTDPRLNDGQALSDTTVLTALQNGIAQVAQGYNDNELLESHILTRITNEGLVIELVDQDTTPLFQVGSTKPSKLLTQLLEIVAVTTKDITNNISIAGHTDARNYKAGTSYTNWELSVDRANVARRLLVNAGFNQRRLEKISGEAATNPLFDDPFAPQNRRITITLLR